MKKRLLLPVLAILSVLMLVACGGQSGPEQTIDNFMKDYKDLKLGTSSIRQTILVDLHLQTQSRIQGLLQTQGL